MTAGLWIARSQPASPSELSVEPITAGLLRVRSWNDQSTYDVRMDGLRWSCGCPDFTRHQVPCQHVSVILDKMVALAGTPAPGHENGVAQRVAQSRLPPHSQDWLVDDSADSDSSPIFDVLLADLLEGIPNRLRPGGLPGRPAIPLRTQYFYAIQKVHSSESSRRVRLRLVETQTPGTGLIGQVPSCNTPSRLFQAPTTRKMLTHLIHRTHPETPFEWNLALT